MHSRKSLLFDNEIAWIKKNQSDRAEVSELIGLFLPDNLSDRYGKTDNIGLYREDGLVLLRKASGPQSERTRKDITREFKKQRLNISISANQKKICNILDATLNLTDGTYYPYREPNNETVYIDTNSNHTIIKHLMALLQTKNSLTKPNQTKKVHLKRARRNTNLHRTQETSSSHHTEQPQEQTKKRNLV